MARAGERVASVFGLTMEAWLEAELMVAGEAEARWEEKAELVVAGGAEALEAKEEEAELVAAGEAEAVEAEVTARAAAVAAGLVVET